jgi:phosphatidylinositol alpha-mannosyltransferase
MTNALLPSEEHSGVPYQVHRLANAFVERNHEVTVFSFSPRPHDAFYNVRQLPRIGRFRKLDPFFFAYRLGELDFSDFDMLHVHGDSFLLWKSHPHIRTFYGSAADEARAAKTLRRRAFFLIINILEHIGARFSDHNVGISEVTRLRFSSDMSVIPCGVDTASFSPGLKTPYPTILFVGTNGGRKRGSWLAELFSREVLPIVPNARLLMVSDADVNLPGVKFLGRVSDERLTELYRSSWLFCSPSTYEGFGVPYIEAMASGTAVIASPNPGACEVLANGQFGALADDRDLGATLVTLLSDGVRRKQWEHAGSLRSKTFRWDTIAARYEHLFNEVRSGGRSFPDSRAYDPGFI